MNTSASAGIGNPDTRAMTTAQKRAHDVSSTACVVASSWLLLWRWTTINRKRQLVHILFIHATSPIEIDMALKSMNSGGERSNGSGAGGAGVSSQLLHVTFRCKLGVVNLPSIHQYN